MRMGKIFSIGVLSALIFAAAYFLWQFYFTEQAPSFITARVTRGDIEETVLASGKLKPARLVAVGSQVSGRITSVKVALGQVVAEGELIAEIDSVTQENALRTAQASVANLKAQLEERQATLTLNEQILARQEQMLSRNAVSRADYENAIATVAQSRAQIAALQAQLTAGQVAIETAQANLDYTRIIAPIAGTVLAIVSPEGQTVNASQSTPTIVILGQLDTMIVRAEISEADVGKVKPGQKVWFTTMGDAATRYDAVLESIEPAPESIRDDTSIVASNSSGAGGSSTEAIYYNGVFQVPNPEGHLKTYMTAQVNIVLGSARDVLTVPASALGAPSDDGRYSIRIIGQDGTVAQRLVETGLNDKVRVEILNGLNEGDRVITGSASSTTQSSGGFGGRRGGPRAMGL